MLFNKLQWYGTARMRVILIALCLQSGCGGEPVVFAPGPEADSIHDVPGVSSSISDAVHEGGNKHFFWLPPMVSHPGAFNGPFDATQTPVVSICDLADCASNQIASFSMASGSGSEVVRVDAADEHYVVNWHTDEFAVTQGSAYRIRVSAGGTLLGYADITLTGSGNEAKNVTTNETIGLKDGRTLPIMFRIEAGAVFVIDPADGGTIDALDGTATLVVPPGAVTGETGFTVESVPPTDGQATIVDLGPDGLTFPDDNPITVTLKYDESALGGVAESDLALNTFEDGEWIIVPGSSVDPTTNTVSAPFYHFSKASVGPAAKAIVCPGDTNPNTFDTFDAAIAALMAGGNLTVCAGTHSVSSVQIDRALTIEGKTGQRPTITTAGFGLVTNFQSGTLKIRNLRLETTFSSPGNSYGSILLIQGAHDQVLVEDVDLDAVPGAGSGAIVAPSLVPGAHVTFRNITVTGGRNSLFFTTTPNSPVGVSVDVVDSSITNPAFRGVVVFDQSVNSGSGAISDVDIDNVTIDADRGVFALRSNGGVGARVDITNSSFSGGAIFYRNGASGLIQGNTFDCVHPSWCIRASSGATWSQMEPLRVIGNTLSAAPNATNRGIWLIEADAGPFEVRDNVLTGSAAGVDRSDPLDYAFREVGIDLENPEVAGVVTGNDVRGAYRGFRTQGGSVKMSADDNRATTTWTAVSLLNGGQMSAHSNDFTDYVVPIDPSEPFADGDLTCNWWGGAGPQGVDAGIASGVFTPWAAASVAGLSITSC